MKRIALFLLALLAACTTTGTGEVRVDLRKVHTAVELAEFRFRDRALLYVDVDPELFDELMKIADGIGAVDDELQRAIAEGNAVPDTATLIAELLSASAPLLVYVSDDPQKQATVREIIFGLRTAVDVWRILLAPTEPTPP